MCFKCESPALPAGPRPRQRVISGRAEGPAGRGEGGGGAVARGVRGNPLFPFPVLPARPSSLPRALGTRGGWIGGGAGYPVSGGERSRRFGTTEKRYNYTTGYKLTLCTTESY